MASFSTTVEEAIGITESLQTNLLVEVLSTTHVRLNIPLPQAAQLAGAGSIQSYHIIPMGAGVPVAVTGVTTGQVTQVTGSTGFVLPTDLAFDDHEDSARGGSEFSNILDLGEDMPQTTSVIGEFIRIQNGENTGRHRIIDLGISSEDVPRSRVYVDQTFRLTDPLNGYVEQSAVVTSAVGDTATFQINDPRITVDRPLTEVIRVRLNGGTLTLPGFGGTEVDILSYRTFQLQSELLYGVQVGDTIPVMVRAEGRLSWSLESGVTTIDLATTPLTLGVDYLIVANLTDKSGNPMSVSSVFTPRGSFRPRVSSSTFRSTTGTVRVTFNTDMRVDDENLCNPGDYTITGPSTVSVTRVTADDPRTVILETTGFGAGSYTLTVSTNTPKDVAGNPLDPTFNTVIFTGGIPEAARSVFTDRGPIAKPPLTLQSGTGATLQAYNRVSLPGATLNSSHIGRYVRLTGGSLNGGSFRISSVLTATTARLANASFTLPDPSSGSLTWSLYDPRHGQIADDPTDVVVRVNGTPVTVSAVIGLLGQVVLSSLPDADDEVEIDYSWVNNPVVDIRRLNSREFRLNAWNRDVGYPNDASQHKYRYNNVLIRPEEYDVDNMNSVLDQPLLRELHYRAFERAYTPVLNDPSTLVLNTPSHQIAYPAPQRPLEEQFVAYEGVGLPESLSVNPWVRRGSGTATAAMGQLTVVDTTTGPYPDGNPIFWTRTIDVTFPHVFALSWRCLISATPITEGVWTGVAAGSSDELVALVVGYLIDGGVKKIGVLKRGFGNDPSDVSAWTGGIASNAPTEAPAAVDWTVIHSYRVFEDFDGGIRVFLDGDVVETLRVSRDDLPYLEELTGPFDQVQDVFFGSLSRPAESTSKWDFVRYLIQPASPTQSMTSSYVNYEGSIVPEAATNPWTPIGYHGTETIQASDFLLLDSTSATDATTASEVGLIGGDFKGFTRFEPLLTQASEFVLDAQVQLLTHTHGPSPYGAMMAVDDGTRLMQVAWFPSVPASKFSYGGRSFPEDFAPYNWETVGTQPVQMLGRTLRISDAVTDDGRVYFINDDVSFKDPLRVLWYDWDYFLEFRCRVVSYTVDGAGFAGVFAQVYDSARTLGVMFEELSGVRYVTFHSDGTPVARFAYEWDDGEFHTYRLTRSGANVTMFVDGTFLDTRPYSAFAATSDPNGQVSFGSSTRTSAGSMSVVDWTYVNTWRVMSSFQRMVGIWKGVDDDSLHGYHLPTKTSGVNAIVAGNALGDPGGDFIARGVAFGDFLVVDDGANRGIYQVSSVGSAVALTINTPFPAQPSTVNYRIIRSIDWSVSSRYRLTRTATGQVNLFKDADVDPIISLSYNSVDLPMSNVGIVRTLGDGLPTIAWGSFDSQNLAQSRWDFVRYGIVRSVSEQGIVPHHQVLNQRNEMGSPERLFTLLPHTLVDFWSSSTGVVPKIEPDFMADPLLPAWTQLNQDTPLVPLTQTFEVRAPYPVEEFVSSLNNPEDVLNNDGDFVLNDMTKRIRLIVPDDVLYSSLDVIEQETGEDDLLAPFDDEGRPTITGITYTKEVCLTYDGTVPPEDDTTAPTPWSLISDNPARVVESNLAGILTYGTDGVGTKTVYRNETPLPDAPSLTTEVKFRLRLLSDTSGGTGETQVVFGLSAPGMTIGLTFLTTSLGERFLVVKDVNNGQMLGAKAFDFLDGAYHDYRLVRDPCAGTVQVFIDS